MNDDHLEKRDQPPRYDDRLKSIAKDDTVPSGPSRPALARGVTGFVLAKIQALEKPMLEEALIDPDGSNPCSCNAVCSCVPDSQCGCHPVCTCDTVNSCSAYCSCIGNCCVGVYWMPCV